jgi:hypothetical protein
MHQEIKPGNPFFNQETLRFGETTEYATILYKETKGILL